MDTTERALSAIRTEWIDQGSPSIPQLAKRANMPTITARRYLDGSTKHGDPAKVRAIAIALGRRDIAETVQDTVTADLSDAIMKFMAEKFLLWRESNLEELEQERNMRVESEKRHAEEVQRIITSKDKSIELLTKRIKQLEEDKTVALTDKERIYGEMAEVRRTKRKRDVMLIIALVLIAALLAAIIAYLIKFDLSTPGYGLFG